MCSSDLLGCPIVYDHEYGQYTYNGGSDPIDYLDILNAIAPKPLNLSVVEVFLKGLDPSTRSAFFASFDDIPDTESDEQQSPRIMTFSSSGVIIPRRHPQLTPDMRKKLNFLIEPLSRLDATARKSFFDSLSS